MPYHIFTVLTEAKGGTKCKSEEIQAGSSNTFKLHWLVSFASPEVLSMIVIVLQQRQEQWAGCIIPEILPRVLKNYEEGREARRTGGGRGG